MERVPITKEGLERLKEELSHLEKVERPQDLPQAIDRALKVIETEKRQALLNVICN